jgi:hypothetical protein
MSHVRVGVARNTRSAAVREARSNNSFNPTLASESFIIKLCGFCYLVYYALASGGLIRALDTLRLVNALDHPSRTAHEPSQMLESQPAPRCCFSCMAMKVASLSLSSFFQVRMARANLSSKRRSNNRLNPTAR